MNRDPTGVEQMERMVADLRQAGYSIDTISKQTGISKNTIWRLQNRQAPQPMWNTFCKLRDFHDRVSARFGDK